LPGLEGARMIRLVKSGLDRDQSAAFSSFVIVGQ
jgi:hypothetical protein